MRVENDERTGAASGPLEVHPRECCYELFANDRLTAPAQSSFNDTATDWEWRQRAGAGSKQEPTAFTPNTKVHEFAMFVVRSSPLVALAQAETQLAATLA